MAKTLTLRLSDNISDELDRIQISAPANTSSGTIQYMITRWQPDQDMLEFQRNQIRELSTEVKRLRSLIESARSSAVQLIEKIPQDDLFSD